MYIQKKFGDDPIGHCPVNRWTHLHRPQQHHHHITIVVLIPLDTRWENNYCSTHTSTRCENNNSSSCFIKSKGGYHPILVISLVQFSHVYLHTIHFKLYPVSAHRFFYSNFTFHYQISARRKSKFFHISIPYF